MNTERKEIRKSQALAQPNSEPCRETISTPEGILPCCKPAGHDDTGKVLLTNEQWEEAQRDTARLDWLQLTHGHTFNQRGAVWLRNLWHWRTAWAVKYLSKQLQRDPGFRESWHANIAMPIYDATHPPASLKQFDPMPIERCNTVADKLLKHLFNA